MIKLSAHQEKNGVKRTVFYNFEEKGFDTNPEVRSDISLLVAYVQIGFNSDDMCANQVFGLSPAYSWVKRKMFLPEEIIKCALKLNEDFDYGTWRVDKGNEWTCYFDPDSEWFCIGEPDNTNETTNINFIDNVIAILEPHGELKALWIKPVFENEELKPKW